MKTDDYKIEHIRNVLYSCAMELQTARCKMAVVEYTIKEQAKRLAELYKELTPKDETPDDLDSTIKHFTD